MWHASLTEGSRQPVSAEQSRWFSDRPIVPIAASLLSPCRLCCPMSSRIPINKGIVRNKVIRQPASDASSLITPHVLVISSEHFPKYTESWFPVRYGSVVTMCNLRKVVIICFIVAPSCSRCCTLHRDFSAVALVLRSRYGLLPSLGTV